MENKIWFRTATSSCSSTTKKVARECRFAVWILVIGVGAISSCDEKSSPNDAVFSESEQETKNVNDYAKTVSDNIERYGFHVTYVAAGEEPSFAYTTGIYETHSIPELLISSLPPGICNELIGHYLNRFKKSAPIIGKRISAIEECFDYYLIPTEIDTIKHRVLASQKYYDGRSFKYLQLVFPDPSMKFPHEEGYLYDQEIFGNFPHKDCKAEQNGIWQAAIRSESDSEGGDKPQPESDGRSR